VPHELIITTHVQENINVRLRSRLSVLRSLSSQNLEATVDLSGVTRGGEIAVPIRASSISLPPDVEVVGVDPSRVALRLEPRRQKIVPVHEYLVGELPNNYNLGPVTVAPKTVLISGPLSLIRDVSEVATDRIILSGRTETFSRTVGLVPENPLISVIEPATVSITAVVIPPGQLIGPPAETSTSPGH
jgi:YbbR domain-containing protein